MNEDGFTKAVGVAYTDGYRDAVEDVLGYMVRNETALVLGIAREYEDSVQGGKKMLALLQVAFAGMRG